MRKSPLSPIPSPHHQRGAGRRGGPSFLLSPSELASQHVVALSPEEARKRLANLALFSSVEHLPESQEVELQTPRGLSKSEMRLLRETHEVIRFRVCVLALFHVVFCQRLRKLRLRKRTSRRFCSNVWKAANSSEK